MAVGQEIDGFGERAGFNQSLDLIRLNEFSLEGTDGRGSLRTSRLLSC